MTEVNKIFISFSVIALFLGFGVSQTQAATASELQQLINTLQTQIQTLTEQVNASQNKPINPVNNNPVANYNFTRDLTVGSTGQDVLALQQFLNNKGFTIAVSGPGAPGNESNYFGNLTKNALAAYQAANGVTPAAGYFGQLTRNLINTPTILPGQPSFLITQPEGGESWQNGETKIIEWSTPFDNSQKYNLSINSITPDCYNCGVSAYIFGTQISDILGSKYSWLVDTEYDRYDNLDPASTTRKHLGEIAIQVCTNEKPYTAEYPNRKCTNTVKVNVGQLVDNGGLYAYDEQKLSQCVSDYDSQQKDYIEKRGYDQFGPGVLLGFFADTSLSSAKEIVESHGLTWQVNANLFSAIQAVHINVPETEKLWWICRLQQDSRIKYSEPNYIRTTTQ